MKSTNTSRRDRIFICPLVPDDVLKRHSLSVAANNFSKNLINGGVFDEVLTYMSPCVDNLDNLTYENPLITTSVSNWMRRTSLGRRFAFIFENISLFRAIKKKSDIWFYNLPYTVMLLFWLLKWFGKSSTVNLILLDYTPEQTGNKSFYKRFELFCFRHFDGVITLANVRGLKHNCMSCLPGVTPLNKVEYPRITEKTSRDFLISGTLNDNITMLSSLLEIFSRTPELTLHITGKAPDEKLMESYTSRCPNIHYHGMVSYEEYLDILHRCPFQLSTRNPEAPENQCNFPSKIIEALLHNRIIVSTIHYPQLDGIRYFEVAPDVAGMTADLRRIASLPAADLLSAANQAEEVHKRFSTAVWRSTMERFESAIR